MISRYIFGTTQKGHALCIIGMLFILIGVLFALPGQRAHAVGNPGPVSKTWYFAEGFVGGGFKEYLTLENPDTVLSCSVNLQYLPATGSVVTKTVTISPSSRLTEPVNNDMNVLSTQPTGMSVSTLVTVNATPACNGIVAERPMYFNYHGVNSGSDVVGATHTAQTFYFADVPSVAGTTSFVASYLTILNPPGGATATVRATYYANGAQVGTQTVSVAGGTRGTIAPGAITLPAHSAAVVTSTQPVVVERPSYFYNVLGGKAGVVTSAASVVGSQTLANDWLFAEGYAGGQTQENLVISNTDTVANAIANVTINLEYANGTKHSFVVTVPTKSQLFWDVNTNGVAGPTPEVSAEVTSTGARIVVERKMFFHYTHTIPGTTVTTAATGGTDVTGQLGPASKTSYSFSEGYTNANYNEWLTLQNPTGQAETVAVTLVNGLGRTYVLSIVVGANSRATVDITAQVLQHLVNLGDAYPAYEVSMTAQTSTPGAVFVAERPEYWNTGTTGTQGGSDVIGYTGG